MQPVPTPSLHSLRAAHRAAKMPIDFDTAMANPLLRWAITMHAQALEARPSNVIRVDFKRLQAGDID